MYRTGRHGSLWFGGLKIARVRDWSLDSNLDLLETTTLDQSAPTHRPGQSSHSGSCTLFYYRLERAEQGLQQPFTVLLNKVHRTGAVEKTDRVQLELRVSDRHGDTIRCNAWITSAGLSTAAGELVAVPISFTVDGHLLEAVS